MNDDVLPVMVKDCSVGTARVSSMDETGVSAADALVLDCVTMTDERMTLLLSVAMAPYLAITCRHIYREAMLNRNSGVRRVWNGLRACVLPVLMIVYFTLCVSWGFLRATEAVAMGLGCWYVLTTVFALLLQLLLRAGVRWLSS